MQLINKDYRKFLNELPKGDYAIADPPWDFNDSKNPAVLKHQVLYERWKNEDVDLIFEKFDVSYIFLWVPNSLLKEVLVRDSKEYVYKTVITWKKLTKTGKTFYGLGNHFRNSTEQLLVFVRKGAKTLRNSRRNIVEEIAGKRTIKPKIFEKELVSFLNDKGFKGYYLFSGDETDCFKEFNIDLIDIIF